MAGLKRISIAISPRLISVNTEKVKLFNDVHDQKEAQMLAQDILTAAGYKIESKNDIGEVWLAKGKQ